MPPASDASASPGAALLTGGAGRVRVKACCISSLAEAALALDAGADALGLVSTMSSGPGVIADSLIAEIAAWVGGRAATVLLTSRQSAEEIVGEAIATVRPFGVDVCSGVRHDGRLDATLVQAFIQATRLVA